MALTQLASRANKMYPGINIVSYYAPTIFQQSLGMDQKQSLFLGCWLQVFYILVSFITVRINALNLCQTLLTDA